MSTERVLVRSGATIATGSGELQAQLTLPVPARAWVVHPLLSGGEAGLLDAGPVAEALAARGLATMTVDLRAATDVPVPVEALGVEAVADRVAEAARWLRREAICGGRPVAYLAERDAAAAALWAAGDADAALTSAVVHRPELAQLESRLAQISCPTLLIAGSAGRAAAEAARARLASAGASLVIDGPGAPSVQQIACVTGDWLDHWLTRVPATAGLGAAVAPRLSRRERRELARHLEKILEDQIREQLHGRSPRPFRRLITAAASALALLIAAGASPVSAGAAVVAQYDSVTNQLSVTAGPADGVTIVCSGGNVAVNSNPMSVFPMPPACGAVKSISISGGNGIDLSGVDSANGFALSGAQGAPPVTISSGHGSDAGTDSITGSEFNDLIDPAGGVNRIVGGPGTDRVIATAPSDGRKFGVNFVLSDSQLTFAAQVSATQNSSAPGDSAADQFVSKDIEQASLTGGAGANVFDATDPSTHAPFSGTATVAAASGGTVALKETGVAGDQKITSGDATQPGQLKVDGTGTTASIVGGAGPNKLDATGYTGSATLGGAGGQDTLVGGGGTTTLDGGAGVDSLVGGTGADAVLTPAASDNNVLTASQLVQGADHDDLSGFGPSDNFTLQGTSGDDSFLIDGVAAGARLDAGTAGNDTLDVRNIAGDATVASPTPPTATISSPTGALGPKTLLGFDQFRIAGDSGQNKLDAFTFTLAALTLGGGGGNDMLIGSAPTAGSFDDSFVGGGGVDSVSLTSGSGDLSVIGDTSSAVMTGSGTDALNSVEAVGLTAGGASPRRISAAGFSGDTSLIGSTGIGDTLTGGAGSDFMDGGDAGANFVRQSNVGGNLTLSANTIQDGAGHTDTVARVSNVSLLGGSGPNAFDGSPATGAPFSVPLYIQGGNGNDYLGGGNGNDTLFGEAGANTVNGGGGALDIVEEYDPLNGTFDYNMSDSRIESRSGGQVVNSDAVVGGIEQYLLSAGQGDNSFDLTGLSKAATIGGGGGSDVVKRNDLAGSPTIAASALTPVGASPESLLGIEQLSLVGSAGRDTLNASAWSAGSVTVRAQGDDDVISGSTKDDLLSGGTGTDLITQTGDVNFQLTNTSMKGLGNDALAGDFEQANLAGTSASLNSGNSFDATGFGGLATLNGGTGTDTVVANRDADMTLTPTSLTIGTGGQPLALLSIEAGQLTGGDGANAINASGFTAGPVTADGGGGADSVAGTPAADSLAGGSSANDTVPSKTKDTVVGGAGNDTLSGGPGNDSVDGGSEANLLIETDTSPKSTIVLTGNAPNPQLTGTLGNDALSGIQNIALTSGAGDDLIDASGFGSSVTLNGATGNDTILDGTGSDSLVGGGDPADLVEISRDRNSSTSGDMTLGGSTSSATILVAGTDTGTITTTPSVTEADSLAGIDEVHMTGGDFNNVLTANVGTSVGTAQLTPFTGRVSMYGGGGNDTETGGAGDDTIAGGPGNDTLDGAAGTKDYVFAGGSSGSSSYVLTNASLIGGNGDSVTGSDNDLLQNFERGAFEGGTGRDTFDATKFGFPVTLSGNGGDDKLMSGTRGGEMYGGAGQDTLAGGLGKDTIDGGAGADKLNGGDDDDRIIARDGTVDDVDCDSGVDFAVVDQVDVLAECEVVDGRAPRSTQGGGGGGGGGDQPAQPAPRAAPTPSPEPPPPPPPVDTTPPVFRVAAPKVATTGAGGDVGLVVSCPATESEGCAGTVTLTTAGPKAGAARTAAAKAPVVLGTAQFKLEAGKRASIRVPLTKQGRRLLAKAKHLDAVVTVKAVDAAGNETTKTSTTTLKAPHRRPARGKKSR